MMLETADDVMLAQVEHTGLVASCLLSVTSVGSGEGSFSRLVSRSSWLAMERSSSVVLLVYHASDTSRR